MRDRLRRTRLLTCCAADAASLAMDCVRRSRESTRVPTACAQTWEAMSDIADAVNATPVVTSKRRRSDTPLAASEAADWTRSSRESTRVPTVCAQTWEAMSDMAEVVRRTPAPTKLRKSLRTSDSWLSVATRLGTRDWKSERKSLSME